jgi:hypothetical protein
VTWLPPLRSYEHYVWMMTGLRVRVTWEVGNGYTSHTVTARLRPA